MFSVGTFWQTFFLVVYFKKKKKGNIRTKRRVKWDTCSIKSTCWVPLPPPPLPSYYNRYYNYNITKLNHTFFLFWLFYRREICYKLVDVHCLGWYIWSAHRIVLNPPLNGNYPTTQSFLFYLSILLFFDDNFCAVAQDACHFFFVLEKKKTVWKYLLRNLKTGLDFVCLCMIIII